jgi:hypothetical protein
MLRRCRQDGQKRRAASRRDRTPGLGWSLQARMSTDCATRIKIKNFIAWTHRSPLEAETLNLPGCSALGRGKLVALATSWLSDAVGRAGHAWHLQSVPLVGRYFPPRSNRPYFVMRRKCACQMLALSFVQERFDRADTPITKLLVRVVAGGGAWSFTTVRKEV